MAQQLLSSMQETWQPESYRDTYRDDVMKLIAQRSKKGAKASPGSSASAQPATKVLDLVAALQRSLASGSGRATGRTAVKRATTRRADELKQVKTAASARKSAKRGAVKKSRGRVA